MINKIHKKKFLVIINKINKKSFVVINNINKNP